MTFIADESGIETSAPREGIKIDTGADVYRIATGTRDVTINAEVYTAAPSARGEIALATSADGSELVVSLPMAHPVPRRWLSGSPPKRVIVTLYRQQGANFRRIHYGWITSIGASDGNRVALLRVPARSTAVLAKRLATVTVGRSCPHVLYDANCRVLRASFAQAATVALVNGQVVTVSTMGANPTDWATHGELRHDPSGERMTVQAQIGTAITLQAPIYGLVTGDAVTIYAGCDHSVATCHSKFANRPNFGGRPHLKTANEQNPGWFGAIIGRP